MDGILTGTTILSQREPRSNGNERVMLFFQELQNWNLTIKYNLFVGEKSLTLLKGKHLAYSKLCQQSRIEKD